MSRLISYSLLVIVLVAGLALALTAALTNSDKKDSASQLNSTAQGSIPVTGASSQVSASNNPSTGHVAWAASQTRATTQSDDLCRRSASANRYSPYARRLVPC
jgi:hypothetical protein